METEENNISQNQIQENEKKMETVKNIILMVN